MTRWNLGALYFCILILGCTHGPTKRDEQAENEYCADSVCIITDEQKSVLNFYVKSSLSKEFTLNIRIETLNPSPNMWPQPQRDFILQSPIEKQLLVSLPLLPDKKAHYSFRFSWRLGSSKVTHDSKTRYALPFDDSGKVEVAQGYDGNFTHKGREKYAFDFDLPIGSRVLAAREGEVVNVEDSYGEGSADPCLDDKGNFVTILHEDGSFGFYEHLLKDSLKVVVGQKIKSGDELALTGNSGYSTGPHLHFEVYKNKDGYDRETIPVQFSTKLRKDFVPKYGEMY